MSRTHNEEQSGEYSETHELNWLPTPGINQEERCQVTGHEARSNHDQGTHGNVV